QKSAAAFLRAAAIIPAINAENRRLDLMHGQRPFERDSSSVYLGLAIAYMRLSDTSHADQALQQSAVRWPQREYFENMSAAYAGVGDLRQAVITLFEGLVMDPSHSKYASLAKELYKLIDPQGCAVVTTGLNLQCPMLHNDVCAASRNVFREFHKRDQQTAADQTRQSAVRDLGCPA